VTQQELAKAQKHTETRMEELAEAPLKTEQTVRQLAQKLDTTSMVGGLSETVGYGLEDRAYQALPRLLKQDFDIETEKPLYRRYIRDHTGAMLEVNIFGATTQAGKRVQVIGEAKSQLSKSKIDEFIRKKLKRLEGAYPSLFPVLVTYMTADPDVEEYANHQGIHLYYSYQVVESS
jgi:hypothetical protein